MIHTGDAIEVMAGMPADSVDAVVTDPPSLPDTAVRLPERRRVA